MTRHLVTIDGAQELVEVAEVTPTRVRVIRANGEERWLELGAAGVAAESAAASSLPRELGS